MSPFRQAVLARLRSGPAATGSPEVRCLFVQSALADYRQQFVDEMERLTDGKVHFLVGTEHFDPTFRTQISSPVVRVGAKNVYLFRRRISWQRGVVRPAVAARLTVQEFNPRILSTWVVLIARRLLGRPSVLWGHAWSRSGPTSRSEPLRRTMRRLADAVVVYTDSQRDELLRQPPRRPVYAAPNAMYTAGSMRAGTARPEHVLWIGRMVAAKKPRLMVEGFARAIDRLPASARLLMIGDGPERGPAEDLARALRIADRVDFVGHAGDLDLLSRLFDSAVVSVSTGYVGLSLIQSLCFGVPMLYAGDEPHAPEIEAATADNSRIFASDHADDLARQLVQVYAERDRWASGRERIVEECRRLYSVEAMTRHFVTALESRQDSDLAVAGR